MNSMITTSPTPLADLLHQFDAVSLGEGDVVAGANVLAAKCISLANLHPPGTCLITPEGNRLPVGMSFVCAGGLTNSLVSEKVLDPIAKIQNTLGDHLTADAANSAAKHASTTPHERLRNRPPPPDKPSVMDNLHLALNGISLARDSAAFRLLLDPYRDQGPGELAATPAVLLNADSVAGLEKQLAQAHLRYPCVRVVLPDGVGMERLESMLLSVVRGTSLPTGVTGPVHVRGHVVASCTDGKLAQSAGGDGESLLANLLWLIEGDSCSLALGQGEGDFPQTYKTHINYHEALQRAMAERLDYRRTDPPTIQFNWEPLQQEWVAFLKKLQSRCPELVLTARPLFGTLIFGLLKLSLVRKGEKTRWLDADALTLAKFLVGRMVQYREQITQTERDSRLLEIAVKVVLKLESGPLAAREITCKMHRLRMAECRDALEFLNRLGVARGVEEGRWELVLPTAQAVKKINNHHYIDV